MSGRQKPGRRRLKRHEESPAVSGFKKKCVCRIHNADLSEESENLLPSSEIVSAIGKYNADPSDAHRLAALSLINNALAANFIAENIDGIDSLILDKGEVQAERVRVLDFHGDGSGFPVVTAEAFFDLSFVSDATDSLIREWESDHDEELAWCVNFFWQRGPGAEPLFLNTGVDGAQFRITN